MHIAEKNKKGIIIPIAEALISSHYEEDIKKFLMDLKVFCLTKKITWPLSKRVCVDWSWASINAIIKVMNNMDSLSTYILKCYNILEENQNNVNFVIIQICCSHFFKTCVKDIKKCSKYDFQINFYRKFMIKAINICDIEDFWRWFKYITILLISKYENNNVKETL